MEREPKSVESKIGGQGNLREEKKNGVGAFKIFEQVIVNIIRLILIWVNETHIYYYNIMYISKIMSISMASSIQLP